MPPALIRPARARVARIALAGLLAAGALAVPVAGADAAPVHAPTHAPAAQARCTTTAAGRACVGAPVTVRDTTRRDARGRDVRTTVVRVRSTVTAAGIRTTTTRWTTRTFVDGRAVRARTRTAVSRHAVGPHTAAHAGTHRTATTSAPAAGRRAATVSSSVERAVLAFSNVERRKAGLAPFAADSRLDAVSRRWSTRMARTGEFRHGGDWSWMPGDRARTGGENLFVFAAPVDEAYARAAVQGWMDSPAHRANLLDPAFTRLGVGLARAADGRVYATQTFAG